MLEMPLNELRAWLMVVFSLSIALLLTLMPMPDGLSFFRPAWVLLILTFWALVLPGRASITLAWVVGLCLDVLNGSLLGEHALALTSVVYFAARLCNQLRMFTLLQQGAAIFFMVLGYQFILFCIQGFLGDLNLGWNYWLTSISSTVLWPWVFMMMRDLQGRIS